MPYFIVTNFQKSLKAAFSNWLCQNRTFRNRWWRHHNYVTKNVTKI